MARGSCAAVLLVLAAVGAGAVRAPSALTHLQELYWSCFAGAGAGPGAEACVGGQVALALDELLRSRRSVPLAGGVRLEQAEDAGEEPLPSPEDARARAHGAAQDVYALIADRLGRLARAYTLRLSLPRDNEDAEDAQEGRARGGLRRLRKMLQPFLVGVVLKWAAFLPLLLSAMALLGLKALGASKLALLITALLGLRKLFAGAGGGGGAQGGLQIEKSYGLLGAALPMEMVSPGAELFAASHAHAAHAALATPHHAYLAQARAHA